VDQANPHVLAKRHQEPSLEGCAVVKEHGLGDRAIASADSGAMGVS
jgi:hypothetical protein